MNNKRFFTAENAGYSINRIKLLRILLDGKVQCYACERKYTSEEKSFKGIPRMDRLEVSDWIVTMLPEKLTIELMCGCLIWNRIRSWTLITLTNMPHLWQERNNLKWKMK